MTKRQGSGLLIENVGDVENGCGERVRLWCGGSG